MTITSVSAPARPPALTPARRLQARFPELVAVPGDEAYERLRTPWNLAVQQRPAAVAEPVTAAQVQQLVWAAADLGLRIAPQGTGHGAQALAARGLDDVLLLRTTGMTAVAVDAGHRLARVQAGAIWDDLVCAAGGYGLAALHGSSPDVGVAGLALGGGIGWYARRFGLTCNSVTALDVVTADGTLLHTGPDRHAELFWALRGGGANLGVVTAVELRLLPIADVYAGRMVWGLDRYEHVLRFWNDWARDAPEEISTSLRAMRFPPFPHLPEELRGRAVVILDGAVTGSDETGRRLLAGFRALRPEIDSWARVPAASIGRMHLDPEGPTPAVGRGGLVRSLDEAAIDGLLAAVGPGADTAVLMAELRQLGGALGRVPDGAGALGRLPGDHAAYLLAAAPTAEHADRGLRDTTAALAALAGVHSGHYLNLAERPVDPRTAFDDATWRRLLAIRAQLDPAGIFLAQHEFVAGPAVQSAE
jgi:FAD/FMN-containing dehydrogenase